MRLKIKDTDGTSSIKQNNAKIIIIAMLKLFIVLLKPNKPKISKPISASIITAFGKTPSQNSLLDDLPLKSNARKKNNIKAFFIVIQ